MTSILTKEQKTLAESFATAVMDNKRSEMIELLTRWTLRGRILATVSPVEVLESIEEREGVFYPITLSMAFYNALPMMIGRPAAAYARDLILAKVGKLIDEVDGVVR